MEKLWTDIRFGIRMLWRSPGFTLVAGLSLALAIGANTTIFTIINAIFLHPLPVQNIESLVFVSGLDQNNAIPAII